VELSPPPLIVMPWGSVALASWLSYPLAAERRSGRLTWTPWPDRPVRTDR
jgi:hypothetical protein